MNRTPNCSYSEGRDEAIVEYLYGEGDSAPRRAFELHLGECRVCRAEVEAFGGVRQALTHWAPPEPTWALDQVRPDVDSRPVSSSTSRSTWAGLRHVPIWARAAAAVLCIGVALGAANLRVTYGTAGVSISTGWLQSAASDAPGPASVPVAEAPWRAELAALGSELRSEIRQVTVPASAEPADVAGEALYQRIRTLIAQSEQRQQRELALRIGDALNDVQAQRRADLSKIDRTIGLIQNNTGMEVMRQREMLNSLAVRVSTQRP